MANTNIRCCKDLLKAVERNCLKCVQILCDDPEQQSLTDYNKRSALHLAVGNLSILIYLLNKIAFLINEKDDYGNTPLCYFLDRKIHSLTVVKLLISRGADVNILNNIRRNSLSLAANSNLEIFKYLWENGAKSHLECGRINVLLRCAHLCNDIELFKYILENKTSLNVDPVNDETLNGQNILHIICKSRDVLVEKIEILLQDEHFSSFGLNKNINKKDNLGMTPLMNFLEYRYEGTDYNIEFLKIFLSLGADPLIENEGRSCIDQTQILSFKKIMIEYQDLPPY